MSKLKKQIETYLFNGKIPDIRNQEINDFLATLHKNQKVKITIDATKKRSKNQNNFYFGYIIPPIKDFFREVSGENFTSEETHDWVVTNVWKHTEYVDILGIITQRRKSSTESDTQLWETYQNITRAYFANLGLQLPFPVKEIDEFKKNHCRAV
jgi:hypothetical protein